MQAGADAGVTVLGDTVNVAARLQALAEPGSAVMSEATHRLVEGLVEASFAGEHPIKGKSDAQKAYRLDGIRERATRFDAKVQRGLTRYVGRDRELEKLERGLDAISAGDPGHRHRRRAWNRQVAPRARVPRADRQGAARGS